MPRKRAEPQRASPLPVLWSPGGKMGRDLPGAADGPHHVLPRDAALYTQPSRSGAPAKGYLLRGCSAQQTQGQVVTCSVGSGKAGPTLLSGRRHPHKPPVLGPLPGRAGDPASGPS